MPLPPRLPSKTVPISKPAEVLVNRYLVQKTLGNGNCGTALLVIDRKVKGGKDQYKVVKKIFIGNLRPDETVDASREALLLRNLDHPCIVHFYDYFIEGDFFCIATEYCEGGDLESRISEYRHAGKRFSESQIVEWLIHLLLALEYMHSRRILHRDLKTRNIFLQKDCVKIGDFGISRILIGTLDVASTFAGTPFYMSPEVLKHEGYNSKSDIWSVGCIMYELASLKRAFDGKTLMGVLHKITQVSPPAWPDEYSEDLGELFCRMVDKNPENRPSAAESLQFSFVRRHIEFLKTTMIEKHHVRNNRDLIDRDVAKLASDVEKISNHDELQKESDLKRFRYLPPRDRMRMEKQKRADEEAERIKANILLQKLESKQNSDRARERNDPYKSKITLGAEPSVGSRPTSARKSFELKAPYTSPILREGISDNLVDDDDDDGTVVIGKSRRPESRTVAFGSQRPRHLSVDNVDVDDDDDDDRTITPSRQQPRLTRHSSLDYAAAGAAGGHRDHFDGDWQDDDELDMVANLEYVLNQDETITNDITVHDDDEAGAFGPAAKELKIKNLRAEAVSKLGQAKFDAIYDYLKKTRFDDRSADKASDVDEQQVRRDLRRICNDADMCAIVEQLLFLEMAAT